MKKERWVVSAKRADFLELRPAAKRIARLFRNRDRAEAFSLFMVFAAFYLFFLLFCLLLWTAHICFFQRASSHTTGHL